MPKKVTYHECDYCQANYDTEEESLVCEKFCKIFNPLTNIQYDKYISYHKSEISKLKVFLDNFQKSNNFKTNPFTLESTRAGVLVSMNLDTENIDCSEKICWLQMYSFLESGTLFKTPSGLEIPISFINIAMDTFIDFVKNVNTTN